MKKFYIATKSLTSYLKMWYFVQNHKMILIPMKNTRLHNFHKLFTA